MTHIVDLVDDVGPEYPIQWISRSTTYVRNISGGLSLERQRTLFSLDTLECLYRPLPCSGDTLNSVSQSVTTVHWPVLVRRLLWRFSLSWLTSCWTCDLWSSTDGVSQEYLCGFVFVYYLSSLGNECHGLVTPWSPSQLCPTPWWPSTLHSLSQHHSPMTPCPFSEPLAPENFVNKQP